jgi:SET domain-containing protein
MNFDLAAHVGWCNPKLEKQQTVAAGISLFAKSPILKDELLAIWGGYVLNTQERNELPDSVQNYAMQIETDYHLTSGGLQNDADYFNHSCNPNAGLRGQIVLIAMRDIAPGEEVCFDYAMCEADPTFEMECACGQSNCRHLITGNDWKQLTLQAKYEGYFSAFIQTLIDQA